MARTKSLKVATVATVKVAILENGSMVLLDEKLGAPTETRSAVKVPSKPDARVTGALGVAKYRTKSGGKLINVAITWIGPNKRNPEDKRVKLAFINKDNTAARYKNWFTNLSDLSEVTLY